MSNLNKNKKLSEETKKKIGEKNSRPFCFQKDGVVYEGVNLKKFCIDNNLTYSGMQNLRRGIVDQYFGFKRVEDDSSTA